MHGHAGLDSWEGTSKYNMRSLSINCWTLGCLKCCKHVRLKVEHVWKGLNRCSHSRTCIYLCIYTWSSGADGYSAKYYLGSKDCHCSFRKSTELQNVFAQVLCVCRWCLWLGPSLSTWQSLVWVMAYAGSWNGLTIPGWSTARPCQPGLDVRDQHKPHCKSSAASIHRPFYVRNALALAEVMRVLSLHKDLEHMEFCCRAYHSQDSCLVATMIRSASAG